MGMYSTTIGHFLPRDIRGITKPRMFEIQRDRNGKIRTRYRLQLQVRNPQQPDSWDHECDSDGQEREHRVAIGRSPDRWMPYNGPHKLGYELFPEGPPLIISDASIKV